MNLTIVDTNHARYWMEVHKTGCTDLLRLRGPQQSTFEADSLTEAAADLAADFIAEGSMTVERALQHIHFAPCVRLPLVVS